MGVDDIKAPDPNSVLLDVTVCILQLESIIRLIVGGVPELQRVALLERELSELRASVTVLVESQVNDDEEPRDV